MTQEWSGIQIDWVDGVGVYASVSVCVFACSSIQKEGRTKQQCPNLLHTIHLTASLS